MNNLQRLTFAVAASLTLSAGLAAQMDGMNMEPAHNTHAQTGTPSGKPAAKEKAVPSPAAMPFGKLADGTDEQSAPVALPTTQTPLRLDLSVQEQEHPERRTGTMQPGVGDALADVRTRPAQSLEDFTGKALSRNPTVREAEAQVRRLKAEAKQQGLWDNPEVGYEADHIRGGVYHSGEQGGYVQQVVPIGGQRSSARSAVQQRAQQAEAALALQKAKVLAGVRQAFYAALAMQIEVNLRQDLLHLASDAAVTAHQLANVGQADAPDILQSEVECEQARLDQATTQREFRKAFSRLAAASGEPTMLATPLQGDFFSVPVLGESAALTSADTSESLHVAEQTVTAEQAAVRSARRQMMPQLTLHAGLQQDNEPLETAQTRVGVVGVAQAGITVPLWNRNQGGVEAAQMSVLQARAAVERTRIQLRSQAEQVMQDYGNATVQARQYREELLPRAERAYQLYQQKYMTMAAAYPQVLVSQRTLFQLRIEYVHALASAWQNALLLQSGLLTGALDEPQQVTAR